MRLTACLFAALVATAALAAPESQFRFHVPAGWLDLSPGAPEENFSQVAPEAAAAARSGRYAAYAFDLAGATESFTANENARIQDAAIQINESTLPRIRADLQGANSAGGTEVTVIDAQLRQIAGAPAARFVSQMRINGTEVRQVTYLIPAGNQTATLTFTLERSKFEQAVDAVDQAALKTEVGPQLAPVRTQRGFGWIGKLLGIAAGAALALYLIRSRRGPRQKQP